MSFIRKFWLILLVAGASVLGGLFYFWGSESYEVLSPHRGPIVEAVYGIGTVTSERTYQVKIGVSATIERLYVKEGDSVKQGADLLRIDRQLIKAPFSGLVTSIPFNEGENVFAQVPVLTLTDVVRRYLSVSLEQQGALRIRAGQSVAISFDSLRGQKFTGQVKTIYPNADQFLAHVDVENLPPEILPGMTADVAIEISRKENATLIPLRAVSQGRLVILKDGSRKKISVKIGNVDGQWAEVISPELSLSDQILVRRVLSP